MAYSVLIKNGTIIDGTGSEPIRGDIGINSGKIDDIGDLSGSKADKIIDAANLYITPGFIDLTNHSDTYWTLFSDPGQESLLMQGITTILTGNCGESMAPIVKKKSFEALERWSTTPSVNADWNSVAEYLEAVAKLRPGVNVATLVGHETLRRGSKTVEDTLTLLVNSLKEGAWGMSSNFSFVEWSKSLDTESVILLKTLQEHSALYKVHLRDEGKDFLPAIGSVLNLVRRTGANTVISHFKGIGKSAWRDFDKALLMIRNSKEDDVPIALDTFPYLRTGSMLVSLLPQWARSGDSEEILTRLQNKETVQKIINELKAITLHGDRIMVYSAMKDKNTIGKTLKEIAESSGMGLEEAMVEILKINRLNVSIFGKTVHKKHLLETVREPGSIIATDGAGFSIESQKSGDLTHPRSFGTYPRYFSKIAPLAKVELHKAVAQATSYPAEKLGLKTRGIIKESFTADLAIFHPKDFRDNATYKNPYRYASGMKYVIIGGKLAVDDGSVVNNKLGNVLKKK